MVPKANKHNNNKKFNFKKCTCFVFYLHILIVVFTICEIIKTRNIDEKK